MSIFNRRSWFLGILFTLIFSILLSACRNTNEKILQETESIIGVRFPPHVELEAESATEFCYVGRMRVRQRDADQFLKELKFFPNPQFQFITTWGRYRDLFSSSEKTEGFLGAIGVIPGKNSWEMAYDPKSEQLWFFMGFALDAPVVPK